MEKYYLKGLLIAALSLMTFSCVKNNEPKTFPPQTYNVGGKVEKGPFVSGSTITMQPMNAKMQASGEIYTSTIQDNAGNFTFGSTLFDTPFAKLTANGYFFNEVSGILSSGTLNLRAIVDLSDKSTINVNILTHLKYQRVVNLVAQGNNFKEANQQAQQELLAAFGLSKYTKTDASLFSITGGNDEAAVLIAVSSLLLVNRNEAELTEYLAKLCYEFGQNGTFSAEIKKRIKEDRDKLSDRLSNVKDNIIDRYNELGVSVEVKELAPFFDWDDDGVAGNEILQDGEKITIETTRIEIPNQGGSYRIKITSPIPVYLEPVGQENIEGPIVGTSEFLKEMYRDVHNQNISAEKTLKDNILTIEVLPLNSRTEKTSVVYIYDCLGNVLGNIDLIQEGNKDASLPLLGKDAEEYMDIMEETFARSLSKYSLMEQYYHHNKQADLVEQYIYPGCNPVLTCWSEFYNFNRMNLLFKKTDAERLNVYQDIFNVFGAMQYYYMITIWGDVLYIKDFNWYHSGNWDITRTDAANILNELKGNLEQAVGVLEEKKNEPLKDADGLFFVSRDVARVLLSNIYMYQNDYGNAAELLKDVIKNGFYELDDSNFSEMQTIDNVLNNKGGKEILFALYNENKGTRSGTDISVQTPPLIPLQTYTDVILSYAECLYKLGNVSEAKEQLNNVIAAKNISISYNDVLTGISEARKQLLLYCISNFAFMKRNGMAKEEYGVEDYRLLLPIPQEEIYKNSKIKQNPGY